MDKLIKKLSEFEKKSPIKLTKWTREIIFDFITSLMKDYHADLIFKKAR
jgi:hypothetical protein